jgi:ribokinase
MVSAVVVGSINWDTTIFVDKFPRPGGEVVAQRITYVPGGKGGNAAVAVARLLAPNETAIIGAVGNDWIATEHVRIFKEEGVDISGLKRNDSIHSGQAYVIVDKSGENQIHTYFGANATILPEDIDNEVRRRLIENARLICIMDPPFETSLKVAKEAKRMGKIVAWDPGAKSQLGFAVTSSLLPYVDYFIANESEVEIFTGATTRKAVARKLATVNPGLKIIMKLGAKGVVMYTGKDQISAAGLDLKKFGLKVVNTVGCGDAFIGALSAALIDGCSDVEALRWANCAAGLKAARPETRGSPDRATLLNCLD